MSESNKKPPLPKPQADPSFDNFSTHQYIELIKNHFEQEVKEMGDKIDGLGKKMEEVMDALGQKVGEAKKGTQDQIETLEGKINSKLDDVDEALRGNGRIGVFEQLRALRLQTKILFSILLLLMGAKVMSLDLGEWTKSLFPHSPHTIEQPVAIPSSQPSTRT